MPAKDVGWSIQATVPMPLEAIHDIIGDGYSGKGSQLLSSIEPTNQGRIVYVTKDFFQASPNGMTSNSVKNDVLGFLSVVVSYVKSEKSIGPNKSYKHSISLMPRTDFVSIYNTIKGSIQGSLYDLVKVLTCYRNTEEGKEVM